MKNKLSSWVYFFKSKWNILPLNNIQKVCAYYVYYIKYYVY